MAEFLYKKLSYSVIGAAIEVHRLLGPGFLEKIYQNALEHELALRNIPFARQIPVEVQYKDISVGEYKADLLIDEKIIVEVKALNALIPAHEAQAINYLAATKTRLALLLNFGTESLQVRRLIH
jgi:GxxExxY protein